MRFALLPNIIPVLAASAAMSFAQVNVLTYHNDNARTGQNLAETILSPSNVNSSTFGKLFTVAMDGKVDAQPLYVSSLAIPGKGTHNVVFAETERDSVYAFDADSGAVYWTVSLLGAGETPSDDRGCGQVTPEIGITSTPVIDLAAGPHGTMYVVGMSKDSSGNYYQRLHALDITTGAEQFGGPVTVQAKYPGSGDNSSGGYVIFDPKQYKDRPGLLLLNGVVYTSWGSHCDIRPYTGWIIGYNETSLAQTSVFNFAPNGSEAALWNAGGAPAADNSGNVFVSVANGTFDTTLTAGGFPTKGDYGNAFVRLALQSGNLTPLDYWTMDNTSSESNNDVDLGSGGIMLLPDVTDNQNKVHHLAVGAGKDTNLYVVDRDNMGKYDSKADATIYQQISDALPGGVWSNPAYFNNYVYFGSVGSNLRAFQISNALVSTSPVSLTSDPFPYPGVTPSVSANGTSNAIVWVVDNNNPAVLHAYDAADLATEYYNSNQASSGRDQFGPGNKFITPTIANGKVFVGTTSSVAVFGLLSQGSQPIPNGRYSIRNVVSKLVMDDLRKSKVSGQQIVQYTSNGDIEQKWIFSFNGAGYYTIQNAASGLFLSDPGGSTSSGTPLEQQTANSSDSQLWSLAKSGSGYVIQNKASGLAADDPGSNPNRGTGLVLSSLNGGTDESWIIR